jgi:hypothetical protein
VYLRCSPGPKTAAGCYNRLHDEAVRKPLLMKVSAKIPAHSSGSAGIKQQQSLRISQ